MFACGQITRIVFAAGKPLRHWCMQNLMNSNGMFTSTRSHLGSAVSVYVGRPSMAIIGVLDQLEPRSGVATRRSRYSFEWSWSRVITEDSMPGRIWTDQQKLEMGELMRAHWSQNPHPMQGRSMSLESRTAISETRKSMTPTGHCQECGHPLYNNQPIGSTCATKHQEAPLIERSVGGW